MSITLLFSNVPYILFILSCMNYAHYAVFWVVLNCTIQCYATVIRDGSVIKQIVTIFTRYSTHDC